MKNTVFWDVTPCGSCKNPRFGGMYHHHQGEKNIVVLSTPILLTLMTEAIRSSETSIHKGPHGVTSQKTIFFIVKAVKRSNLT
jgi:hypothetical protein